MRVTLADVADLSALPPAIRRRAGNAVLAQFRRGQETMILTPEWIARRVRGLIPALSGWTPAAGAPPVVVRFQGALAANVQTVSPRSCVEVIEALPAGSVPVQSDLAPASCREERSGHAFRYDPEIRVLRAARDLIEGELIAAPAIRLPDVGPGASLTLTARSGPVTVTREVTAMQPASRGQAVFVRTADGRLISVPYGEIEP